MDNNTDNSNEARTSNDNNFIPANISDKHKIWILSCVLGAVAVVALCIGGYTYYQDYKSKPNYVFNRLMDAYKDKDSIAFEQYIDLDAFSQQLWSDYPINLFDRQDTIWFPLRNDIHSADEVKMTVRNVVSGNKSLTDIDTIAGTSEVTVSMASLLDKMHGSTVTTVSDEGTKKIFKVTAKTYDEREFVFEFTMELKNNSWKITKLNNVNDICLNFRNFYKESVIDYLKRAQPLQDECLEGSKAAEKMPGSRESWLYNDYPTYSEYMKSSYPRVKEYLLARKAAEEKRVKLFSEIKTNPFSNIVNSNRINFSKNYVEKCEFMLKWLEEGLKRKSFYPNEVRELREKAQAASEKADECNERVGSVIMAVGYRVNN